MKTQTKPLAVKEGRTELATSSRTFVHPSYGPNTYFFVGESIAIDGYQRPTMADTADLVHTAFNSDDRYSKEIKGIMKDRWLWAFTGNLYLPNKGVYIQDNPEIRDGRVIMDESDLVKKLESKDPSVRFVPFGFETESMSSMQLAKNAYVIALAGEEGADKLAEVADEFKQKPYLWSFKSVNEPTTRVSALDSNWGLDHWLGVVGSDDGDSRGGRAFGVRNVGAKK